MSRTKIKEMIFIEPITLIYMIIMCVIAVLAPFIINKKMKESDKMEPLIIVIMCISIIGAGTRLAPEKVADLIYSVIWTILLIPLIIVTIIKLYLFLITPKKPRKDRRGNPKHDNDDVDDTNRYWDMPYEINWYGSPPDDAAEIESTVSYIMSSEKFEDSYSLKSRLQSALPYRIYVDRVTLSIWSWEIYLSES